MKVGFFDAAAPDDEPMYVWQVHVVPRKGELVVIENDTWLVGVVTHVMVPDDEPRVQVLLTLCSGDNIEDI